MQIIKRVGLLISSVLLIYLSWPPSSMGPLMFVALVPLIFYLDDYKKEGIKRYLYSFIGFFIVLYVFGYWTSINAWGAYDDSVREGVLISVFPKAFLLSFIGFIKNRKRSFVLMIFIWASVEILQTYWEFNAPLLMIGNSLSDFPILIQHYSIWGVFGGSMLIIAINLSIYYIFRQFLIKQRPNRSHWISISALFIPFLASPLLFLTKSENNKHKIAIVAGHFDHFTRVYSENPMFLVNTYNELLSSKSLEGVELVVFPESAVVNGGWIENLNNVNFQNPLDSLCPGKEILFGSHMFSIYNGSNTSDYRVRWQEESNFHYLCHNCIVFRDDQRQYSLRSKEKYIPFHESIPYPSIFSFAKNWYSKEAVPTYLIKYENSHDESFRTNQQIYVSPLMCFESTFTDMALRNSDADIIMVLANESWNDELRGKEQYWTYLKAKAIESGKPILKVANGGFSGLISPNGEEICKFGFENPLYEIIEVETSGARSIYSSISGLFSTLIVLTAIVGFLFQFILERRVK